MRTIMISDIHGCLAEFDKLLNAVEYRPERDRLILLGDYVDRGPNSKEVVERIIELVHVHGAIAIKGNHDQRLVDLINLRDVKDKFMEHGGLATIASYTDGKELILDEAIEYIRDHYRFQINFLDSLPLFHEDRNHIYVHAGINPDVAEWKQQSEHDFLYIKEQFINHCTRVDKKVVFGHTKTIDIHGTANVWFSEDKIGIDGGCAYGFQLNGLIYDAMNYETMVVPKGN